MLKNYQYIKMIKTDVEHIDELDAFWPRESSQEISYLVCWQRQSKLTIRSMKIVKKNQDNVYFWVTYRSASL